MPGVHHVLLERRTTGLGTGRDRKDRADDE
jgi:hypothetical protein